MTPRHDPRLVAQKLELACMLAEVENGKPAGAVIRLRAEDGWFLASLLRRTSKAAWAEAQNEARKRKSDQHQAGYQSKANVIWDSRPDLSATAVARLIAQGTRAKPDTIRRRIRKKAVTAARQ
jgi:hypothetical protein